MFRKYYLVEVVIILLLSHGGWNGSSVTLLSCTSEASRLVRDVVQARFSPVVARYQVPLPLECPLHPERDMFERLQTRIEGAWRCPVCGLPFTSESTFVTHWDAKHARTLGMAAETVCLDDYCDVFRCDVLRKKEQLREMKQYANLGAHSNIHKPDEEQRNAAIEKQQCDPKEMKQLRNKCRSLIRQCTVGLLANLSSIDFQDIEDDLDQSICSFLTCDKYWDDFESQVYEVPILVKGIFTLMLTCLFCFFYYGIYILMEKMHAYAAVPLYCNCQNPQPQQAEIHKKPRHQKPRHKPTGVDERSQLTGLSKPSSATTSQDVFLNHSGDSTIAVDVISNTPIRCSSITPTRQNSQFDTHLRAPRHSQDWYGYSSNCFET